MIIAPDMPGFGRSPGKKNSSRSETNLDAGGPVEILLHILDKLAVKSAVFIGYSWGGGVAISMALKAPQYVSKLILWHGSYTDNDKQLKSMKIPTLVLWVSYSLQMKKPTVM